MICSMSSQLQVKMHGGSESSCVLYCPTQLWFCNPNNGGFDYTFRFTMINKLAGRRRGIISLDPDHPKVL